jgi:hypothetical protein
MTRVQLIQILFYYSHTPISKYYRCYINAFAFVVNIVIIIVVVAVQFFVVVLVMVVVQLLE